MSLYCCMLVPATVTARLGTVARPALSWASAGLSVRAMKYLPWRVTLSPDASSVSCLTTVTPRVVSAGLQKSNARRSKVSWRPNRTPRRTGLADSIFVSQSRRAVGLLALVLGKPVLVLGKPVLVLGKPVPVVGLLIVGLALLRFGPEVPGLGLGVTWGVTLVTEVG